MEDMLTVASGPYDMKCAFKLEIPANGTQSCRRIIGNQDTDTAISGFHSAPPGNPKRPTTVDECAPGGPGGKCS